MAKHEVVLYSCLVVTVLFDTLGTCWYDTSVACAQYVTCHHTHTNIHTLLVRGLRALAVHSIIVMIRARIFSKIAALESNGQDS